MQMDHMLIFFGHCAEAVVAPTGPLLNSPSAFIHFRKTILCFFAAEFSKGQRLI